MTELEDEVRRELRWFPRAWSRDNGDALLGTVLDTAEAQGRTRLTAAERGDLRRAGLRQHGLMLLPRRSRELAAALALGAGAAFASVLLVVGEWAPWSDSGWRQQVPAGFGPFASAGALVELLWLAGFAFGMLPSRAPMVVAFAASLSLGVAISLVPLSPWTQLRPSTTELAVLAALALVASLVPLHGIRRLRRSTGMVAGAFAVVLTVSVALYPGAVEVAGGGRDLMFLLNPLAITLLVAGTVVVLDLAGADRAGADAVLIALGPVLALVIGSAIVVDRYRGDPSVALVGTLALVALLALRGAGVRLRLARAA